MASICIHFDPLRSLALFFFKNLLYLLKSIDQNWVRTFLSRFFNGMNIHLPSKSFEIQLINIQLRIPVFAHGLSRKCLPEQPIYPLCEFILLSFDRLFDVVGLNQDTSSGRNEFCRNSWWNGWLHSIMYFKIRLMKIQVFVAIWWK